MVLLRGLRVRMGVASGISQGRKVRSFLTGLQHDITLLVSMAHAHGLILPLDGTMSMVTSHCSRCSRPPPPSPSNNVSTSV